MELWQDFKKFAFKGNVIDLAVGVVIGAAFGKIVSALVADLIMPLVALTMPAGDWRENVFVLRQGAKPSEMVALKYGDILGAILDFFIIAFVLFLVVSKLVRAAEGRLMQSGSPCIRRRVSSARSDLFNFREIATQNTARPSESSLTPPPPLVLLRRTFAARSIVGAAIRPLN